MLGADANLVQGLSPRVRGNLIWLASCRIIRGSIPACAGKPTACGPNRTGCRVYPRVCGETMDGATDEIKDPGLSPRVRGNRSPMIVSGL